MPKFSTIPTYFPTEQRVENFFKQHNVIVHYSIQNDCVHISGDLDLSGKNITLLPFAFGNVFGNVNLSDNQLNSFKNFPKFIEGSLDCSNNQISHLAQCPEVIQEDFYCMYNPIERLELEDLPKEVKGACSFGHEDKRIELLEEHYQYSCYYLMYTLEVDLETIKATLLKKQLENKLAKKTPTQKLKI